jgi:hypothetical protein
VVQIANVEKHLSVEVMGLEQLSDVFGEFLPDKAKRSN